MNYEDLTMNELRTEEKNVCFKGFVTKIRLRKRQNELAKNFSKGNLKKMKKTLKRYKELRVKQIDLTIEKMSREINSLQG